ncbi:MAG: aspartyl protease family protein [Pseudomonadota bacterium]
MTKINALVGALIFFSLGFVASEYRHFLRAYSDDTTAATTGVASVAKLATDNAHPSAKINNELSLVLPLQEPGDLENDKAAITVLPATDAFSWERINRLIASEQYEEAARLLRRYLETDMNSAQAWFLLANIYQKQAKHKLSIDAWLHYLKLEVDAKKIDQAIRQIKKYLAMLNENITFIDGDSTWLIAQLNALLNFSLNDGELHLLLASLYLSLADEYQAQYHALMAANDPVAQQRAEEILAKLNGKTKPVSEDLAIPLIRFGNQFLVGVSIEGHPARLLLDTGASLSGVSKSYTAKYPSIVKATKPIRLNTASGTEDSYLFTVNDLSFGSLVFSQHILALLPMGDMEHFDGLLGVDILGRFEFVIDQDESVLRLRERKKR